MDFVWKNLDDGDGGEMSMSDIQHNTLRIPDYILKNSFRKHLIWTIVIFS